MNDIFFEYLVKKKSNTDIIKQAMLIISCVLVLFLSLYLCLFVFLRYIWILPMLWGACIYGTVILRRNYSIEYEYIFTNGQLDIDIIKGKTTRKHLVSLPCRKIEYMAPFVSENMSDRIVIDTIYDEKKRGKYYIDYTESGEKMRLLIQPPEKLLENIKKYNPRNVNL